MSADYDNSSQEVHAEDIASWNHNPHMESEHEMDWRRVHKITPLTKLGALWVMLFLLIFNFGEEIVKNGEFRSFVEKASHLPLHRILTVLAIALGALLVVSVIVVFVSYMLWRATSFAIDVSGVHWRSGVLNRQHVQVRWDRVQSVEIQQKLFGRLFGFGTVRVESAGSEEDVDLGLLKIKDCVALRTEVLTRLEYARSGGLHKREVHSLAPDSLASARGDDSTLEGATETSEPHLSSTDANGNSLSEPGSITLGTVEHRSVEQTRASGVDEGHPHSLGTGNMQMGEAAHGIPGSQEAHSQVIFELGNRRLIAAKLLDGTAVITLILFIIVGIAAILTDNFSFLAVVIIVVGALWTFVKSLFDEFGTRISLSHNGLRKRSGLTKLTTRTYPPQRVHGLMIDQPILWRFTGWWRLTVSVAGINAADLNDLNRVLALAGSKNEILRVMWALLPSLGSDDDAALTEAAMSESGNGRFFQGATPKAKNLDPISWRSRGIALTPKVMVIRSGRWHRRVSVILQDHTQSLTLKQGPLQRRFGLASLEADMVIGVVKSEAENIRIEQALELMEKERILSAQARDVGVSESLNEWMARVGVK